MLKDDKIKLLQELVEGLDRAELSWLGGYMTGLAAVKTVAILPAAVNAPVTQVPAKITIAYGTESGNAKKLAAGFVKRAKDFGIQAKLVNLAQYRLNDLPKEEYFFTVISTQGDGEPPESARKFYDHLNTNKDRLEQLKYGVLALGDTSYPLFCKAGEDVDGWLGELGGTRLVSLKRCDTDYAKDAEIWFEQVLDQLKTGNGTLSPAPVAEPKPAGRHLYEGMVISNVNLNDRGSAKQTHHLEISADGVDYQPGDSLGIVPENPFRIIQGILSVTKIPQTKIIQRRDELLSVEQWLKKRLNIIYLSERVVKNYAAITGHDIPVTRIGLLDLLRIYPVQNVSQFEEIIEILEPITPRLYSISSSPNLHTGEIHLTVALEKFITGQEIQFGLCSDHLTGQQAGSMLNFYIHKNHLFKLPAPEADLIMIGPGTGIAPFRSFIGEREATGATGRNWLFFGDQHFNSDFLYQTEIQDWSQNGTLTHVNLAFSRDQEQKIYVQHRLLEHGAEIYEWITRGASLYVCGAKEPMAKDVEAALLEIGALYGNETDAQSWLNSLEEQSRYLKDVY